MGKIRNPAYPRKQGAATVAAIKAAVDAYSIQMQKERLKKG
jgi:hypothetical protein